MSELDRDATMRQGLEAYREGRFFDAHEHWEDIWRAEADPDRRRLLQGLVQLAAGLHKLRSGIRPGGAPTLLKRAADKLEQSPTSAYGVDPPVLATRVRRLQQEASEALAKSSQGPYDVTIPELG